MSEKNKLYPEHTAVRVALWRALHLLIDAEPHVFKDDLGAKIVAEDGWQNRPDMNPDFSRAMRASIVGRARFIEDLVEEQLRLGVTQYVILGAGLDTFALRRPDIAEKMQVFEVDQPGPQGWKQARLHAMGQKIPSSLHFVPVDFERGETWLDLLLESGFDKQKPAVVVSTGVSMYLSLEANLNLLRQMAHLAPSSTFAMTFMLTLELLESRERSIMEYVMERAQEGGTPFVSLFNPDELLKMAQSQGLEARYISAQDIYQKYFAKRPDQLRAGHAEAFLLCKTQKL